MFVQIKWMQCTQENEIIIKVSRGMTAIEYGGRYHEILSSFNQSYG